MIRTLTIATLLLLTAHSHGQEWAKKMFKAQKHDFGSVARNSKQEFAFELNNLYLEDVHIASVRSSCGCTSPRITKQTLKTYEKSQIIAKYNTHSFLGSRGATLTVVIDKPYYAEVQLRVTGYIRSDLVFEPNVIDFGSVPEGSPAEAKMRVSYAGNDQWRIQDVRSASEFLSVDLKELRRGGGRVDYEMSVKLKPGAPAGVLQEQLTLISNASSRKNAPLSVEGQIISPLAVSPASLFLGILQTGDETSKRLVIRSKEPFRILNINYDQECLEITKPSGDTAKKVYLLPVKFTAIKPGKVARTIEIETDLNGAKVTCIATAAVKEAPPTEESKAEVADNE